jgi:hypothetical protein
MVCEEAIIDDLIEAVVRMVKVERVEESRRHSHDALTVDGHPLTCRENPQMALEMHRFKATAIRQRGIADDLQLHQLREQVRWCVLNQNLGHLPTYAALHLQFRIVRGQKSLALISCPRYDNARLPATGDPLMGGIAKW